MIGKILKRAGFGFLLGVAFGTAVAIVVGWPDSLVSEKLLKLAGGPNAALLWQTLFSGLLGAVSIAGTCLYDLDGWPLLRIAVVHYLIIEAAYLPAALLLDWIKTGLSAAIHAGCQAVAYLIIFLILWASYRAQVKQANELIEQRKETKET